MARNDDNSGALFKNKDKETEKHPDYNGSATIGGTEYWVSAWINEGGPTSRIPGEKYMALRFNVKENRQPTSPVRTPDDIDDDIPF